MVNRIKNKKKLFIIVVAVFLSLSCFTKDFHFVYIRLDNSMDKDIFKEQIVKLKTTFTNSDFVLFYSNAEIVMDVQTWNQQELFGLISNQSSSVAVSVFDELENISVLLEKYLQMEIIEDDFGMKQIKSKFDYESISFDCFIGEEFFDNDKQNSLFARMLFANSLNQQNYNVDIFYYPCGANYTDEIVKFNSQYSINKKSEIKKSL